MLCASVWGFALPCGALIVCRALNVGVQPRVCIAGATQLLRSPTYSTAGIPGANNHVAPIVAMETIVAATAGSTPRPALPSDAEATSGRAVPTQHRSFQIATLDLEGVFKTWTVVEVPESDTGGSLQDLGLLPGDNAPFHAPTFYPTRPRIFLTHSYSPSPRALLHACVLRSTDGLV